MMAFLNLVVVFNYGLLSLILYDHGTLAAEPLIRRLKYCALATAFMCFGVGRMTYIPAEGTSNDWIFFLGHFAFQFFGYLYFITGYMLVHGETPSTRWRHRKAQLLAAARMARQEVKENSNDRKS